MMILTSLFFGAILMAAFANGGEDLSCQVNSMSNKIIAIRESQKLNPETAVLHRLINTSSSECQDSCCKNSQCTLFVYHHKNDLKYGSCYLVSCSPKEKCVYQDFQGSLVGEISRIASVPSEKTTVGSEHTTSAPGSTVPMANVVHAQLNEKYADAQATAVSVLTTSLPVSTSNTAPKESQSVSVNVAPTTLLPSVSSTQSSVKSPLVSSGSTPPAQLQSTPITSQGHAISTVDKENVTVSATVGNIAGIVAKTSEHTTVASLVIALCFGLLFLFAVVILIGRPWWDAFNKPRYSKVDYLMNGL